jgi:enamine deaminase RidA (YjgF/YER057c/UK114 family)
VFLRDINDFAAMNEVYKTYFKRTHPPRTRFRPAISLPALVLKSTVSPLWTNATVELHGKAHSLGTSRMRRYC